MKLSLIFIEIEIKLVLSQHASYVVMEVFNRSNVFFK